MCGMSTLVIRNEDRRELSFRLAELNNAYHRSITNLYCQKRDS